LIFPCDAFANAFAAEALNIYEYQHPNWFLSFLEEEEKKENERDDEKEKGEKEKKEMKKEEEKIKEKKTEVVKSPPSNPLHPNYHSPPSTTSSSPLSSFSQVTIEGAIDLGRDDMTMPLGRRFLSARIVENVLKLSLEDLCRFLLARGAKKLKLSSIPILSQNQFFKVDIAKRLKGKVNVFALSLCGMVFITTVEELPKNRFRLSTFLDALESDEEVRIFFDSNEIANALFERADKVGEREVRSEKEWEVREKVSLLKDATAFVNKSFADVYFFH